MRAERRKLLRFDSRVVAVVKMLKTGQVKHSFSRNLGGGGVCLTTDEVLESGTLLEVELRLPDRATPIAFQGVVSWSVLSWTGGTAQGPTAETGVQFVSIDPKDRADLLLYAKINAPPAANAP